jgi:hypothetical protein
VTGLQDLTAFIDEVAASRPADRESAERRLRFLAKGALYDTAALIEANGDVVAAAKDAQDVARAVYVASLLLARN